VAVLQTADGRFLTRRKPTNASQIGQGGRSSLWHPDFGTDGVANAQGDVLASYAHIYCSQPTVAAVVNKLSRQISTLPLKAYRRVDDNRRERLPGDHPLSLLLRRPLPRKGAVSTKQWLAFPWLLHGNALVGKVRQDPDSPPYALVPLDWTQLSAYAESGQFVEWWSTTQFGDDERWIRAEDAIHVAWESPSGELGVSPLDQLGVTIQVDDAAKRQQRAAFRNGIFPSIAVTLGGGQNGRPPDKEMIDLTRDTLNTIHKNPDQAFKALLLAPDTKVETLAITAREAELLETRQVNREEVAMCYDVPPPLIGDLRHATLANLKEFGRQFYTDILRPWLTVIEETLQAQLIDNEPWSEPDLYVEFDLSEQLKGDPQELANSLEVQIRSGQITPNEARAIQNRPPDGDASDPENPANKLYLPVNNLQPVGTQVPASPDTVGDRDPDELPPPAAPA
jgi:HK97 family phage portal protein